MPNAGVLNANFQVPAAVLIFSGMRLMYWSDGCRGSENRFYFHKILLASKTPKSSIFITNIVVLNAKKQGVLNAKIGA